MIKQGENEGLCACVKGFQWAQEMPEQHSGKISLAEHVKKTEGCNDNKKEEHCGKACDQLPVCAFIVGGNATREGNLSDDSVKCPWGQQMPSGLS